VHAHGDRGGGTLHALARRDSRVGAPNISGFLDQHMDLKSRRLAQMAVDHNATTLTTTHMPVPVVVASATSSKDNRHGDFVQLNTSSVSGNVASIMPAVHFTMPMMPALILKARVGSVTSSRYWVGMFDADPSAVAYDVAASSGLVAFGFSYDSAVATGNWQAIVSDGTSQTTTDTGIAVTANTTWTFDVIADDPASGDEVRFYIDGFLVATETSYITAGSVDLMWAVTRTNLAASSSNFRIGLVTFTKAG